jgi:hypothetical protein
MSLVSVKSKSAARIAESYRCGSHGNCWKKTLRKNIESSHRTALTIVLRSISFVNSKENNFETLSILCSLVDLLLIYVRKFVSMLETVSSKASSS